MADTSVPVDRDATISAGSFYWRLLRKLTHKGVLKTLVQLQRLTDDTDHSFPGELQRVAERLPDHTSILFEGRSWTWAEVNAECNRYAHAFKAEGIGKGDIVAVCVPNRPEMLFVVMGILKLGAVAALQNTGLQGEVLAHSISLVDPKALVVGEEQLEHLESLPEAAKAYADQLYWLPDSGEAATPDGFTDIAALTGEAATTNLPETDAITFGDDCVYIYTSGTTGLPKAAVQPHRRLAMGGLFAGRALRELTADDVVYNALPLYHSNGLMGGWSACVFTGAAFVPARKFSASSFWDEVREYGATSFTYIGEVLRYLMNQPPSPKDRQHQVSNIQGAGLRAEMWHEFKDRFGIETIYEVYGASESPSGFMNLFNFDRTCGWMPRGWTTVAWDEQTQTPRRGPDGLCQELGTGDVGLLIMKIDATQHFDGYTDEDATKRKILTDVLEHGDRWFNTGDLVLKQGHGHMRFVDRTGDTFRWNSENVATTQVESVINTWPQIADAVAYGVDVPDTEGRCGMARVILEDGEELDVEGFAAHLRAGLPKYAVPRFLRIGDEAEVTGTFKHRKGPLKDQGYDLDAIDEPVLVMLPGDQAYHPLTPELVADIESGAARL